MLLGTSIMNRIFKLLQWSFPRQYVAGFCGVGGGLMFVCGVPLGLLIEVLKHVGSLTNILEATGIQFTVNEQAQPAD